MKLTIVFISYIFILNQSVVVSFRHSSCFKIILFFFNIFIKFPSPFLGCHSFNLHPRITTYIGLLRSLLLLLLLLLLSLILLRILSRNFIKFKHFHRHFSAKLFIFHINRLKLVQKRLKMLRNYSQTELILDIFRNHILQMTSNLLTSNLQFKFLVKFHFKHHSTILSSTYFLVFPIYYIIMSLPKKKQFNSRILLIMYD